MSCTSTGIITGLSFVPCVDPSVYLIVTFASCFPGFEGSGFSTTVIDSITLFSGGVIFPFKISSVISFPSGVSSFSVFIGLTIGVAANLSLYIASITVTLSVYLLLAKSILTAGFTSVNLSSASPACTFCHSLNT